MQVQGRNTLREEIATASTASRFPAVDTVLRGKASLKKLHPVLKRMGFLLFALLAGGYPARPDAVTPTSSWAEAGMRKYEDLYRWGEYDSLISLLEPRLAALKDSGAGSSRSGARAATQAELARVHLALGVAYWATGRTMEANRTFLQALRLDPDQRLDPLYSTPEMIIHHETLAKVERSRTGTGPSDRSPAPALPPQGSRREKSHWLMWTGVVASAALAAGVYYIAQQRPPGRDTIQVVIPTE